MCKKCIVRQLKKLRKGQQLIMSKITDFAAATKTALDAANLAIAAGVTALQNISADQANLAKQITDLQAQLLNENLSPESEAALAEVTTLAQTVASNAATAAADAQTVADQVPDAPAPPPVP